MPANRITWPLVIILAVSLAALAAGCSTLAVHSDYDPTVDFSKFKTFTITRNGTLDTQLTQDRIDRAITAALETKGLTSVASGGELTVQTQIRRSTESQYITTGYGGGGWGWNNWVGPGMTTTQVREVPVGTLVVDLVDAAANRLVWRGTASDYLTNVTPQEADQKAQNAMMKLFETFPPNVPPKK